jgi:hypothetical protein
MVEVWTSGRQVVREGHVQGVDLAQLEKSLRGAYRSGLVGTEKLQELWPTVEQNIGDYYRGCC